MGKRGIVEGEGEAGPFVERKTVEGIDPRTQDLSLRPTLND